MKKTVLLLCVLLAALSSKAQRYLITHYGVQTDSTRVQTKVIQAVIDEASSAGGGTIVVPPGVFMTGALFFKPHTCLELQAGAKLKGSDNIDDYPLIPSRMEGHNLYYYAALINAYYVNHFSITGPGSLDGNGLFFWKAFWAHRDSCVNAHIPWTNLEVHRPRLVFLWGCDDVRLLRVQLHNSGFWTTHLYQCRNVLIDSCDIRSQFHPVPAPSTDGIDIDVCRHVTVKHCYISVDDDGVCIKGGKGPEAQQLPGDGAVSDVLVEDCRFGRVNAALTFGSECIHASHITMLRCEVNNQQPIVLFKMRPDTYQTFEHIRIDSISGTCGAIVIMSPWKQFFDMHGSKAKPFGILRDLCISHIRVHCHEFGQMKGNIRDQVSDIRFRDMKVSAFHPDLCTPYSSIQSSRVIVNGNPLKTNSL